MPDAAIRSMNPRTTAPSQLGERQFSNVDIRARAESVEPFDRTRNGSASSNSIGSEPHSTWAEASILIIGAKIIVHAPDLPVGGGSDGRKFVRGSTVLTMETVRALCCELPEKIDARDVGRALTLFAQQQGRKAGSFADDFNISNTVIKELTRLDRITSAVSALIDSSSRWPTRENLVHVSRGKSEADQFDRWGQIERGETRKTRRENGYTEFRAVKLGATVKQLRVALAMVTQIDGFLAEAEFTSDEKHAIDTLDDLMIELSCQARRIRARERRDANLSLVPK